MTGRTTAIDDVPGLRDLARRQSGVVRREQLARLGVTRHHVRSHVAAHRWRTLGPRLVVLHTGGLARRHLFVAGVLHASDISENGEPYAAALAGRTALEHRGLTGWAKDVVDVSTPRGKRPPPLVGFAFHQCGWWDDTVVVPHEVPAYLRPAWAVLDAASRETRPRNASGLALAAVQQRLTTVDELVVALNGIGLVRHAAALRQALASADSDSLAEVDVADLLERAGLGPVRRNVTVLTASGPRRLDLLATLPDGRTLVVEVDGLHHRSAAQQADDAIRDADLVALGYVVLRIPVAALRDRAALLERFRALARRKAG